MSTARRTTTRIRFAAAMLLMCAGAVQGQQPSKTLTMQASWPASSTFMDNFNQFADRVNKTTAGRLQIKTSAAGTIVPAFEVTDATHKGVLDGAHTWSGYLIGKHPAAVLFTGGPGGPFGMDLFDHLGWYYDGGGQQLMDEWFETIIKRDVISLPILPFTPQMFGWFKQPFKDLGRPQGPKMRAVGMNAQILQRRRRHGGQHARRGDRSVRTARRDRRRGMVLPRGGHEARIPQRLEVLLHAEHARDDRSGRSHHLESGLEIAFAGPPGNHQDGRHGNVSALVAHLQPGECKDARRDAHQARRQRQRARPPKC